MMQRIATLAVFLFYRLATSLSGLGFLLGAAVYYYLAFRVRTPEPAYFTLVIGLFGAGATFLVVLSVAGKANQAQSYPFFPRLESRVEFLAAVFLAGASFALLLQILMTAVVFLRNGPAMSAGQLLEIPPIWLSANIMLAVLALHASDFVASGWSRIRLYGLLAVLIIIGDSYSTIANWLAERLRALSFQPATNETSLAFANNLRRWADALSNSSGSLLEEMAGLVFWPFRAVIDAVINGFFSRTQALAPAVLVLAATLLFLWAANVFARKDLFLVED